MNGLTCMALTALLVTALCGCATHRAQDSLQLPAAMINTTKGTVTANFKKAIKTDDLKRGESDEVTHFCWPYPPILVTVGDETVKKAMENGHISELYWADYEINHYVIVASIKVIAYGK